MCGIAGKLLFDNNARISRSEIEAMLRPIVHRGPDGQGIHLDRNLGLGHNRLAIIDLDTGSQPMANEDETIWIILNGEIYNFKELRERLVAKGHLFRTKSDTEVIVHAYEEYGVECLEHLRGMFTFAIWDGKIRRLFLARDRVGIKPLYYCQSADGLAFASELKSLISDRNVGRDIDLAALGQFFSFYYIPGERTLFKAIRKLLPGHYLLVEDGKVSVRCYWDLEFGRSRAETSFDDCVGELHDLLSSTVRDHMIADVPVGVLLSGGVDSSAVLSFAVNGTRKKVQTFTVGFDGAEVVDERPFAQLVSQRFGTEHYDLTISEHEFWDFLPKYVWHMEEPICEPPAVALYYVSKLARNHVKVLLSGEGGDEAFAGYPNYPNMLRIDRLGASMGILARPMGALAVAAGRILNDERVERYGACLGRPLSSQYFSRTSGPTAFFNRRKSTFFTSDFTRETAGGSPETFVEDFVARTNGASLLDKMLYVDTKTWLPDDLLVKADKMTMANSLELRVPFLDHKVLEFAASLSSDLKVRGTETKRILRAVFSKVLPSEVLNRKKAGFPVPYEDWLRRDRTGFVKDILLSEGAVARGYADRNQISKLLKENSKNGRRAKEIFSLLILELWHRAFLDSPKSRSTDAVPSVCSAN